MKDYVEQHIFCYSAASFSIIQYQALDRFQIGLNEENRLPTNAEDSYKY